MWCVVAMKTHYEDADNFVILEESGTMIENTNRGC